MHNPLPKLKHWINQENQQGTPDACCAVLSTVHSHNALPHGRVVAIREITDTALLFFTQKGSRKVKEIQANPQGSMTFWFALHQREVMLEGSLEALTEQDNQAYWETYSRLSQIRFYSYAPSSGMPIENKSVLEAQKMQIENEYQNKLLPIHPDYCGFSFMPHRIVFYTYRTDELSDVIEYQYTHGQWNQQWLSP